jgi:hypothetical protein
MADESWNLAALPRDDSALAAQVTTVFEEIYRRHFAAEESANHALPVEVRALRRVEGWRVMLVLTPWMLARLYLPESTPGLPLPPGWTAEERAGTPFTVIGPLCHFQLLGEAHRAHLNYHPGLGHHLLLPLAQAMGRYPSADAVFAGWNEVIATRDRVMAEGKRECPWQRDMSRREFFVGAGR